jgi:hypothetical protein
MAKRADQELFDRLRAGGLRKKVASTVAGAVSTTTRGRKPPKQVDRVVSELRALAAEIEDRAKGGPAKREATARKAAATRRRNAAKRSEAAKKAARTRAKSRA